MPEHSHDDHAMLLVPFLSSMTIRDHELGGRRALEPRYFYFADAGMPHATQANKAKQKHLAVYLSRDWQQHILKQLGSYKNPRHRAGIWRMTDDAADLGRVLVRKIHNPTEGVRLLDRLGEMFVEECLAQIHSEAPTSQNHPFDHGAAIVLDAMLCIRRDLSQPITPQTLAAELGVSRRHLSRLFREKAGRSIAEAVREERLQEARRLLLETNWSVQQVSGMCGIENASQFSTAFKHRFGQPPVHYRRPDT